MIEFIKGLSDSDLISYWGTIATVAFSVITAAVAIFTLRQNSKMIEESTRPYIVVYFDIIRISSFIPRFIIKNFGKSGARITDFKYPGILKAGDFGIDSTSFIEQLDGVRNLFLAPNQSIHIGFTEIPQGIETLEFAITYTSGHKEYIDSFKLNVGKSPMRNSLRESINDKNAMPMIGKALQEMCDRL